MVFQACQDYTRYIKDLIPKSDQSPHPTSVILIGCGDPSLIKSYVRRTGCPYPIYTDPTLRLQRLLGCRRWGGILWGFGKKPEYTRDPCAAESGFKSIWERYKSSRADSLIGDDSGLDGSNSQGAKCQNSPQSGLKKHVSTGNFRSGPIFQVGGEFLFEEGKLIWCHLMKGMRNHAEIKMLRRVLDIEDDTDAFEERLDSKWVEQELDEYAKQGRQPPKQLRRRTGQVSLNKDCLSWRGKPSMETISDEDEDGYVEQHLGRKPTLPSAENKIQLVRAACSPHAYLSRYNVICHRVSGIVTDSAKCIPER